MGLAIHEKLTGKTVNETMKKLDQASSFSVVSKPIKVGNSEIKMSTSEVYQRLLSITYNQGEPTSDIFLYHPHYSKIMA